MSGGEAVYKPLIPDEVGMAPQPQHSEWVETWQGAYQ